MKAWRSAMKAAVSASIRLPCSMLRTPKSTAQRMALGLAWIGAVPMAQVWPFMALALLLQGLGLGVFQLVYADQVVATLPDSARGLSGSLTLVTRTVGIVGAAMVWLWMMALLQSRALVHGVSQPEAMWAGTIGLLPWAAGVALGLLLLSVWRWSSRWH